MRKLFLVFIFFIFLLSTSYAGIITLSWTAPITNTDGLPLTNLAGFKIYYGSGSGQYTSVVNVGNVTSYVLNLSQGTYYFAVTAYNTSGNESVYSNEVLKVVGESIPSPPSNLVGVVTGVSIL